MIKSQKFFHRSYAKANKGKPFLSMIHPMRPFNITDYNYVLSSHSIYNTLIFSPDQGIGRWVLSPTCRCSHRGLSELPCSTSFCLEESAHLR